MDSPTLDRLPEQQETGLPGPLAAEGGLSVRLVSDYICPWCYIGRVRLERLRWELPLAIELWAFDLRPGLPPEGLPREAVYKETPERRERQQYLRSLAAEEGIALARPPIVPDTQRAHQATEYAKKQGKGLEFSLAVFRAYWRGEENIGELSVLTRLASEVGLDSLELERALAEARYDDDVKEQVRWARWSGVTGIPTFIFNQRYALIGAQPYDVLKAAAQRASNAGPGPAVSLD